MALSSGEFYKRPCDEGLRFEVVMDRAVDSPPCQQQLEALGIKVSRDAFLGHFAVELTGTTPELKEQWLRVTEVVMGGIYDENHQPIEVPLAS